MCARNVTPDLRFYTGDPITRNWFAPGANQIKSRGSYPFLDSRQVENSKAQRLSQAVLPVIQKAVIPVDKRKEKQFQIIKISGGAT
jgi:hypothetical protein